MADFLDQAFPETSERPAPEPAPEALEQLAEAPAPEPVVEPAPAIEPAPVEALKEQHAIPIATALQWRDEAKELKRWKEQQEAQAKPAATPDPFDDPAGYAASVEAKVGEQVSNLRFQMSDQMARQVHGAETVDAAVQWAQEKANADPLFAASYMRDANPIDWIVRQHKRDALLSEIGDNKDDWFAREAATRGYVPQSAAQPMAAPIPVVAQTQPAVKPPAPPRSIASDAPASASTQGDPRAEFMAIFDRK